jgi:hypothetical protein
LGVKQIHIEDMMLRTSWTMVLNHLKIWLAVLQEYTSFFTNIDLELCVLTIQDDEKKAKASVRDFYMLARGNGRHTHKPRGPNLHRLLMQGRCPNAGQKGDCFLSFRNLSGPALLATSVRSLPTILPAVTEIEGQF